MRGLQRRRSGRRSRREAGFTLVEIIVVMGILAILTSMLLSVTVKTRERANRAVCTSNLRQLLMACKMYEADNEHLPIHSPVPLYGPAGHWQEQVYPYVKNRALFLCRSDPSGGTDVSGSLGGWPTSYGYLLSDLWFTPEGAYRPPAPRSPLLLDDHHLRVGGPVRGGLQFAAKDAVFLIGRYDGSVEAAPILRYQKIFYEPADGGGIIPRRWP